MTQMTDAMTMTLMLNHQTVAEGAIVEKLRCRRSQRHLNRLMRQFCTDRVNVAKICPR